MMRFIHPTQQYQNGARFSQTGVFLKSKDISSESDVVQRITLVMADPMSKQQKSVISMVVQYP